MSESNSTQSASASINENVVRILSLLKSGDEKLNFAETNDAILVLGNTGSGKSTFTQFLAGNNDDLIATEVGKNTGEFIIVDNNNKISRNHTLISKTLIPEKVINRETKMVVIDFPGFGDSGRNEAFDIAAAYFIKKVLENVKNIKIMFTVSYSSLREGVSRTDFLKLLEHANVLFKNIGKYVDGMALVATKVDNLYYRPNNVLTSVPDSTIIENIAEFLLHAKESVKSMKNLDQVYQSESKRVKDELFFENTEKLLTTLLQKNGPENLRLGIFRRPDAPGPISQSNLLQREKKIIENMLQNNLKYVPVDITDIGYSISDKSKNIIRDLVAEVDKTIFSNMVRLNKNLIDHFKKLEIEMLDDDMYSLIEILKNDFSNLTRISSIKLSAKAEDLVSEMRSNLFKFCKASTKPLLDDVANLIRFYNFLENTSDQKFEYTAWKLANEIQAAINYVENSVKWYDFLAVLYQRLSEYDIQRDIGRFHIPDFDSVSSGPLGNYKNFTTFIDEISSLNFLKVLNFQDLMKVNIDVTKVRYFDRVVLSTLRAFPNFVTENSDQRVLHRAESIRMEDGTIQTKYSAETVQLTLPHSPNLIRDKSISRLLVTGEFVKLSELIGRNEYKNCKSVQIFAKHTLFVDADVVKNIDISIISPRWVITGSRKIDLSGSAGRSHVPSYAPNGVNVDGNRNGHDGKPGNPGESAGHFFGIGNSFENIQNLEVRAVGGDGGVGQTGGDGARGKNGAENQIDNCLTMPCYSNEDCYSNVTILPYITWTEFKIEYIKYASQGGRGGNAGRGGAPGIGGDSGSITLLGTGDSKPSVFAKKARGKDGKFGLYGNCGSGGYGSAGFQTKWSNRYRTCEKKPYGSASYGESGTCIYRSSLDTSNYENRQKPVPKAFLFPPSFAISDFRKELIPNLKDTVKKRQALEFYEMLQEQEIIERDEPELIFREYASLQMSHNQLVFNTTRLLYNSLLERVQKNYKNPRKVLTSKDHKLSEFLSLAINSQLVRFESKSESHQISNLRTYFDPLITTDVAKIRQFFIARAKDEIKSAEHLISVINDDIFYNIRRTRNEIIRLSQIDTNNELEHQLLRMKLFSNLKVIGDFLMLCSYLAEAGLALVETLQVSSAMPFIQTTISAVVQVSSAMPFIQTTISAVVQVSSAMPFIQTTISPVDGLQIAKRLSIIEESLGKCMDAVRNSISKLAMVLEASGIEYDEICDQLQEVDFIIQSRNLPYFRILHVIQHVRNSIDEVLLKEPNAVVQDAVNELEQDFILIEFSARLYDTLLIQKIDSSKIVSCIKNLDIKRFAKGSLAERAKYMDETIDDIINAFSLLCHTRETLMGDSYKPDNGFIVKVSQALNYVKPNISKLLQQVDIGEDLHSTIENIDEAVDALYSIFNDVLLSIHDRFLFSSFYTYLKQKTEWENPIQDYLVGVIEANALFYEYERSLDVYRKYYSPIDLATPFAPPVPNIDETLSIYRSSIATNVQILESKLNSLDENRSNHTLSNDFNRSNKNGAFYTWKSQNYKESTLKLLCGKKIALKSTNVNKNFGFLKFDDIKLSFKSDDPSIQQSLNKDLSDFNVVMVHSGRSYFNFCDRVQLMNQESVRFIYKINETVTEVNGSKARLMKPLLSPYTTWIFQLKPVNENVTFSSLLPYHRTKISIALEGNATYVDLQNKTICQNILENHDEIAAASSDSTYQPKLIRKRRDVDSSQGTFGTRIKKFFNPFLNLIGSNSDPRFDHSSNPKLEGSNFEPNQSINFLPLFNMNAALTLANFVVRNFTTVKPYQSVEPSVRPEEARVIALNILEQFENILKNLAQDEPDDPIKLICQLEKFILRQEYSKIIDVLSQSVTLDSSLEKVVRRELTQVVKQSIDGSVHRSDIDTQYSRLSEGLLCNQSDDSSNVMNGNFDHPLLN